LKSVIGELALIGGCSGNLTIAVPSPSPTIASGQSGARLGDGRRRQLALGADRKTGGVEGAVAVEEEGQFFEDRRQFAGGGRDRAAAVQRDRRVFVARQRLRREASFGFDDEVAGLQVECLGDRGEAGAGDSATAVANKRRRRRLLIRRRR
jgi:hypothetical protein